MRILYIAFVLFVSCAWRPSPDLLREYHEVCKEAGKNLIWHSSYENGAGGDFKLSCLAPGSYQPQGW